MSKVKKILYSIAAGLLAVLILFAWWQTSRLKSVTAERNRIRYTSLRSLLDESQRNLDDAARTLSNSRDSQMRASSSVATALALLDTASQVAERPTNEKLRTEWEKVRDLQTNVSNPTLPQTQDDLRKEAANIRDITQDFVANQ